MRMNRRAFVTSMIAVAAGRVVKAQVPPETANLWGSPVIDCHFHPRPTLEANLAHLNGSGCQAAYMLARLTAADDAKRFMAQEPTRFAGYSVSTNVSEPDAVKLLTEAVKAGAHGFGEVKFHVAADGPEMRRLYAAAAELDVPVTIHFQEVPHTPTEGVFNTGFKRFDGILKQFPKTHLRWTLRCILGQCERGLCERQGLPENAHRARRDHRQMALGLSKPVRGFVCELRQQCADPRSLLYG